MAVNNCPYCNDTLLRHARQKGVYWFCMSCCQEVPSLLANSTPRRETSGQRYATAQPTARTSQV